MTTYPVCPRCGGTGKLGYRPFLNRLSAEKAKVKMAALRQRRLKYGIKQYEMAAAMNVPVATLANWETRGRAPRPRSEVQRYEEVLHELAEKFGVKS